MVTLLTPRIGTKREDVYAKFEAKDLAAGRGIACGSGILAGLA
jgi:hypothetical protein